MTIKVTLSRPPAAVEFEVGSFSEVVGMLSDNETTLVQLFTIADRMNGGGEAAGADEPAEQGTDAAVTKPPRKPRTPKVEAVAPAPLPVPGANTTVLPPNQLAAPAASDLTIPADGGVPGFLQRAPAAPAAPTAAAPPPPPPLPSAPPIVPAAPTLATKVVAELERRANASADKGEALAAWLAGSGVVKAGTGYGEAIAAVALATDVQLDPVHDALFKA